jgi:hypothetical protein
VSVRVRVSVAFAFTFALPKPAAGFVFLCNPEVSHKSIFVVIQCQVCKRVLRAVLYQASLLAIFQAAAAARYGQNMPAGGQALA